LLFFFTSLRAAKILVFIFKNLPSELSDSVNRSNPVEYYCSMVIVCSKTKQSKKVVTLVLEPRVLVGKQKSEGTRVWRVRHLLLFSVLSCHLTLNAISDWLLQITYPQNRIQILPFTFLPSIEGILTPLVKNSFCCELSILSM
jgi:hypothetical protein